MQQENRPFVNEHACRLLDPGQFVRFVRDNGKSPNVVIGYRADGTCAVQSYRYPVADWTERAARAHSVEHGGAFEAAAPDQDPIRSVVGQRLQRFAPKVRPEIHIRELGDLCELRADEQDGKPPTIVGYASVFDTPSVDLGGFTERIAKGAFAKSLKRGDEVVALIEHAGGLNTLGRRSSKTLDLVEDDKGLRTTIFPPNTSAGRDALELVRRGDLGKMSFAFIPRDEDWNDDFSERTIKSADLLDVSLVAQPAYPDTSAGLRSMRDTEKKRAEGSARVLERFKRHKQAVAKAALLGVS